jgi:hypothetical protein
MIKPALALFAAALLASSAAAQSETLALQSRGFEAQALEIIKPFVPVDAFAGVPECSIVDAHTLRAWTLSEAQARLAPCLDAVARRRGAKIDAEAGFVADAQDGRPAQAGLLIKTDLVPGGPDDRALSFAIAHRGGKLLGQPARVLARGDLAPESVSAVQGTLKRCMVIDVVRSIRTGADFISIYGKCLTSDAALAIRDLRAGDGLSVSMKTAQPSVQAVDSLNGYVTVNAGEGPVQVMVMASAAQ